MPRTMLADCAAVSLFVPAVWCTTAARSGSLRIVHVIVDSSAPQPARETTRGAEADTPDSASTCPAAGASRGVGGAAAVTDRVPLCAAISATASGEVATVCSSPGRSEEHTSELQSRENLVCRLLLETEKELSDR